MSREDYLKLEEVSTEQHEFYQEQVFAMADDSFQHARIGLNVTTELAVSLRAKLCQPMNSDMRIVTPSGLNTYLDASVYCGKPELSDNHKTLLNPVLIVEVLSPSTRSYDRGDKFHHYHSIPSLRDYLLIDSETILVEHYQRMGAYEWSLHEYRQLTDGLSLESIGQPLTVCFYCIRLTIHILILHCIRAIIFA